MTCADTRLRRWMLALVMLIVLAGYPLVASITEILGVTGTAYSIAMRVALVGLCGMMIFLYSSLTFSKIAAWMFISASLFWMLYFIRMVNDTLLETNKILLFEPYLYWLWGIGASFLPFVAMALARFAPEDGTRIYFLALLVTLAAILLTIPNMSTIYISATGESYNGGRAQLAALNSISLGHLGVQLILLAVVGLIGRISQLSLARLGLFVICLGSGGYVTLVANSRGPFVALIVCLAFLALTMNVKGRSLVLIVGLLLGLFIVPITNLVDQFAGTSIYNRIFGQSQWTEFSTLSRIDTYSSAFSLFVENPIIGFGLEDPAFGGYPHNLLIEAFMATGIFGGIGFLCLCILSLISAAKTARMAPSFAWITVLTVQQVIASQFSGSLAQAAVMWPLLGATIALAREN